MGHETDSPTRTGTDAHRTGADRHATNRDNQAFPSPGITHSIRPGVSCPDTVLVVLMSNDSYLLVGHPQTGPTAFLVRDDAGPLRKALETAFGSPVAESSGDRNSAGK